MFLTRRKEEASLFLVAGDSILRSPMLVSDPVCRSMARNMCFLGEVWSSATGLCSLNVTTDS